MLSLCMVSGWLISHPTETWEGSWLLCSTLLAGFAIVLVGVSRVRTLGGRILAAGIVAHAVVLLYAGHLVRRQQVERLVEANAMTLAQALQEESAHVRLRGSRECYAGSLEKRVMLVTCSSLLLYGDLVLVLGEQDRIQTRWTSKPFDQWDEIEAIAGELKRRRSEVPPNSIE